MTEPLFTLRVQLFRKEYDKRKIVIRAWDGGMAGSATHNRIDIEVRHGGEIIFARGDTWCATPYSIDGIEARESVLSCVAMKPGDTDEEYFASYTPKQLAWASKYGEALSGEREARYCDKNGNCKSD